MTCPVQIVALARRWIGTPYLHQASLCHVGCDCLGLLRGVWRDLYGSEPFAPPPYTADWAEATGQETLAQAARHHLIEIALAQAVAGDVLLFRWRDNLPAKHCGILTAPLTMVHAHDGACVSEVSIGPWWQRHRAYAFRFPDNPSIESD
jgi:NlpC/P60 family putative phage cell wall peptidase